MKILIGFIIFIVVTNLMMVYLIYRAPSIDDNGNITETLVESIQIVEEMSTVYAISCEPQDWFIAGGYLVHNK